MNNVKRIRVVANAAGYGAVFLNDQDISDSVKGVQVMVSRGEVGQVLLDIIPGSVDLDVESLPHIVDRAAVSMDHIDPKHLEKMALDRMGMDGDCDNIVEATLACLKEIANGS